MRQPVTGLVISLGYSFSVDGCGCCSNFAGAFVADLDNRRLRKRRILSTGILRRSAGNCHPRDPAHESARTHKAPLLKFAGGECTRTLSQVWLHSPVVADVSSSADVWTGGIAWRSLCSLEIHAGVGSARIHSCKNLSRPTQTMRTIGPNSSRSGWTLSMMC